MVVNHVWLRHFGDPLVESVFDFGRRAERPEHLALLDYLAVELVESGWSLKHLHRLLVTSDAYRRLGRIYGEIPLPTVIVQEGGYSLAAIESVAPRFVSEFLDEQKP